MQVSWLELSSLLKSNLGLVDSVGKGFEENLEE